MYEWTSKLWEMRLCDLFLFEMQGFLEDEGLKLKSGQVVKLHVESEGFLVDWLVFWLVVGGHVLVGQGLLHRDPRRRVERQKAVQEVEGGTRVPGKQPEINLKAKIGRSFRAYFRGFHCFLFLRSVVLILPKKFFSVDSFCETLSHVKEY